MHLDLIRYLFILEVNSSLVWLPRWPAADLSLLLGKAISERLPIVQARLWRKALAAWETTEKSNRRDNGPHRPIPPAPWPIDAVLFWYPAKRTYGKGERILFELKLVGSAADHGMFIEVILPAMEQIARFPEHGSRRHNALWGHFDIRSVYTAKGSSWKPLIRNRRLDLRRKVTASQWSRGLRFGAGSSNSLGRITWLTPFDFRAPGKTPPSPGKKSRVYAPKLPRIMEAISRRISSIILGKYAKADDFLENLDADERASWKKAMRMASRAPLYRNNIKKSSALVPGQGIGSQTFATRIPDEVIPYLELGSMVHIGEYTHFGCGAYVML